MRRLDIKLRADKWEPILKKISSIMQETSRSNAETIQKCLFYCYMTCTEKKKGLNNKTRMNYLVDEIWGDNTEAALVDFLHKYIKFIKGEKPWNGA